MVDAAIGFRDAPRVPKTTAEAEHVRRDLIRELMPPGELPVSEEELTAAMLEVFRRAGTPGDIVHAFRKTGRLVTEENMHLLSEEELAEWDAAIEEYRSQRRPTRRRWRR
jgi:hypothetical protein